MKATRRTASSPPMPPDAPQVNQVQYLSWSFSGKMWAWLEFGTKTGPNATGVWNATKPEHLRVHNRFNLINLTESTV